MVRDDFFSQPKENPPSKKEKTGQDIKSGSTLESSLGASLDAQLASPYDRFAAFVADSILFWPIMSLLISSFSRHSVDAQIMGNEDAWLTAKISAGVASVIACILYQTVFVAAFGATPGKMALRLKVVPVWEKRKVRSLEAFLRSIAWCLEIALFGAPFIAVFGNERRRPLHDRVAETIVIVDGKKRFSVGRPSLAEMSLASGVQAAVLACCALVVSFQIFHSHGDSHTARIAEEMEEKGQLCQEVGEAQKTWSTPTGKAGKMPSRLTVAMTMFTADLLDENCLKLESDFSLWRNEDKALAYLARGLSDSANDKIYDSYLDKACETEADSDACRMVGLVRSSEDENFAGETQAREDEIDSVIATLGQTTSDEGSAYLKVWAIRHLMDRGDYSKALALIDSVVPSQHLGAFFARERAMALWLVGKKEDARLAMRTSMDLLDSNSSVELSRWFCSNETAEEGCSEASRISCGLLSDAVDRTSHLLSSSEIAATYVKAETCRARISREKLADLEEKILDRDGKSYVEALSLLENNKRESAIDRLKKIADVHDGSGPFYFAANSRLAELAGSPEELKVIRDRWMQQDSSEEGWKLLGHTLLEKLGSIHAWDQALSVGLKMAEFQKTDRTLYKSMIVAAFHAGNQSVAEGLIERFSKMQTQMQSQAVGPQSRLPASADGYDDVVKEIESRKTGAK
jgi:uncharacterized RDD family membrane protein YckC